MKTSYHNIVDIERWIAQFAIEVPNASKRQVPEGIAETHALSPRKRFSASKKLSLAKLNPDIPAGGTAISSPCHLARVEQIRRHVLGEQYSGDATHVFVYAIGEPRSPFLTKYGGIPYRDCKKPWPVDAKGKPLVFVGQVCFLDSVELAPELPGDVLLVFSSFGHSISEASFADNFHVAFEWSRVDENPKLTPKLPEIHYGKVLSCHGHLFPTFDLVQDSKCFAQYRRPDLLQCLSGTKIGGIPHFAQRSSKKMGQFLCSMGSVRPVLDTPFPFINQEASIDWYSKTEVVWRDSGVLNIFWTRDSKLKWEIQST